MKSRTAYAKLVKLANYSHPDEFGAMLGYKLTKLDRKNSKAETILKIRHDHLSPAGRVHGGVVSAFFDYSFGAAVFTTLGEHDLCSTIELKVNYLKPLVLGDTLQCKVSVVFRGKRLCVLNGLIFKNREKAPVAMATASFNIVVGKP